VRTTRLSIPRSTQRGEVIEHRLKPRVEVGYIVRLPGVDGGNKPFQKEAGMKNLSVSGLYASCTLSPLQESVNAIAATDCGVRKTQD
jgi:hypothetical protein